MEKNEVIVENVWKVWGFACPSCGRTGRVRDTWFYLVKGYNRPIYRTSCDNEHCCFEYTVIKPKEGV